MMGQWKKCQDWLGRSRWNPARLKVFPQILAVIGVMFLVILIQAVLSFKVIEEMQAITMQVFRQNAGWLSDIGKSKYELEKIRVNYLRVMSGAEAFLTSTAMLNETTRKIETLSVGNEIEMSSLRENFGKLEKILRQPAGETGYQQLYQSIFQINMELDSMESGISNNALNTIEASKRYSNTSKLQTLVIALLGLVFAVVIGLNIAASISKPLQRMVAATDALATGHLTEHIALNKGSSEVREMATGLSRAINGLCALIQGINQQSDVLFAASQELKEASGDTGRSATQVAQAMEELSKASSEQSEQIEQAVETINLLSQLVRKVSDDTEMIAAASEQVAGSAQEGQQATDRVARQISELYTTTQGVAEVIGELNQTSEEIGAITTVIEGIAEQTTLLALNAAIEAARAGEHGKGFSVVAKETGKLADQSKQAAQLIAGMITRMRQRTGVAVEAIQQGIIRAEEGKNLAEATNKTFENILKVLMNNLTQIETVVKSARQMSASNENVIVAISTIATIAEGTLASTQEVSATAEEQNASVQQVTALAENLTEIAKHLKQAIAQFAV